MYDAGFGIWGMVSTLVNVVLGGGFLITFLTLRAQRRKATAEANGAQATAESTELDNVEKAIKIWREIAESLSSQKSELAILVVNLQKELVEQRIKGDELSTQVGKLSRQVATLNCTSNKILKMLDRITHENLENMIEEIKGELKNEM